MHQDHAPRPLTVSDLALLRSIKAWHGETGPRFWQLFGPEWRSSLRWGWESLGTEDVQTAIDTLRSEHAAQARPDLARVHATWWVRVLKAEPPSVQKAVAANLPSGIAEAIRGSLNLALDALRPDRTAHPSALQITLSVWTVRLVGDVPVRDDDPQVIAALTQVDTPTIAWIIHAAGLAKWALTSRPAPSSDSKDFERMDHFRRALANVDSRFVPIADRDVDALKPGHPRSAARLGLTTIARLLGVAQPYRARWALQHVPYATAKAILALMPPPGRRTPMLARWESELLRAAWQRMHDEGRAPTPEVSRIAP
jgi:hypothetical protein